MSYTNIESFVESDWGHAITIECNNAKGFENFEIIIARLATVEAWFILIPATYEMINILIPGIPKGCKFFDEIDEKNVYLERGKKIELFLCLVLFCIYELCLSS